MAKKTYRRIFRQMLITTSATASFSNPALTRTPLLYTFGVLLRSTSTRHEVRVGIIAVYLGRLRQPITSQLGKVLDEYDLIIH